jgi:general secretion pathway protein M
MTNVTETFTATIRSTSANKWFVSKSDRDRRVLKLLAAVAGLLVCYIGIWEPLSRYAAEQQLQANRAQSTADWLVTNRGALEATASSSSAAATGNRAAAPTIAQITNSAATFNLMFSRLQPEADGSVSVALEQQPFNAVVQWLVGIENEQGFTIDRASIDRTNEQGLVNAQLRIR